jgi:hypothetical protein
MKRDEAKYLPLFPEHVVELVDIAAADAQASLAAATQLVHSKLFGTYHLVHMPNFSLAELGPMYFEAAAKQGRLILVWRTAEKKELLGLTVLGDVMEMPHRPGKAQFVATVVGRPNAECTDYEPGVIEAVLETLRVRSESLGHSAVGGYQFYLPFQLEANARAGFERETPTHMMLFEWQNGALLAKLSSQ